MHHTFRLGTPAFVSLFLLLSLLPVSANNDTVRSTDHFMRFEWGSVLDFAKDAPRITSNISDIIAGNTISGILIDDTQKSFEIYFNPDGTYIRLDGEYEFSEYKEGKWGICDSDDGELIRMDAFSPGCVYLFWKKNETDSFSKDRIILSQQLEKDNKYTFIVAGGYELKSGMSQQIKEFLDNRKIQSKSDNNNYIKDLKLAYHTYIKAKECSDYGFEFYDGDIKKIISMAKSIESQIGSQDKSKEIWSEVVSYEKDNPLSKISSEFIIKSMCNEIRQTISDISMFEIPDEKPF